VGDDAAAIILKELRTLRAQVATISHAPDPRKPLTSREAEKIHRLSHGTIEDDYKAGKIRGKYRSSRGRNGQCLYVSAIDCERLYGMSYCTETSK